MGQSSVRLDDGTAMLVAFDGREIAYVEVTVGVCVVNSGGDALG
jgi:hypothetical protein